MGMPVARLADLCSRTPGVFRRAQT